MPPRQDWRAMMQQHAELLERRTGQGVPGWRDRITRQALPDEAALRAWLTSQGVDGYPQQLLVFETFGYPDFLTATASDLIDAQYQDRPALRPILDRLIAAAESLGEVTVQARKGFVALQTQRRKFAVIKPATKTRVDLGLRIDPAASGSRRFQPADPGRNNDMQAKAALTTPQDVDGEVTDALRRAYSANQ